MSIRSLCRGGVALAALLAAAPVPALAQQTTTEIRGVVADADGAAVADAKVTVIHLPTGTPTILGTNDRGAFSARGLRPGGPYSILVEKDGLQSAEQTDVFINLSDPYRTSFVLSAAGTAGVEELVVVGERRIIDLPSGSVLNRDRIDGVATIRRDLRDTLRRDPLATQNTGGNGGISIAGQLPQANRLTIDGVSAKDNFGINTGGLPTSRGPVSLDAIEQLSINTAPFDVEEGDLLGGSVNVTLKSGSNEFEGVGFWETNREFLDGERVDGRTVSTPFDGRTYGGVLSGPILKDRLFFSGSYEDFRTTGATAVGPQGASPPFATERNISEAQFAEISNIVRDTYRYEPLGIPRSTPGIDRKWHARLDANITDDHRAQFTYRSARDNFVSRPSPAGVANSLTDSSYWYNLIQNDTSFSGQINSDWTDAFSTEFRVTRRNYDRDQNPLGPNDNAEGTAESDALEFPEVLVCFDPTSVGAATSCTTNVPTLAFGPDRFRHANILRTKSTNYKAKAQYLAGNHQIKAGYELQRNDDSNLIVPNSEGIYYFDSVTDFRAGRANQFIYGNSLDGIARNASADFAFNINTAYVQDTWDINPWLTLMAGLRYDLYTSQSGPQFSQPFATRYAAQGLVNDAFIGGRDVFQPRFGFEVRPDDEWTINGGFGLFSTLISDVLALSGAVANDGVRTNQVQISRSGANFVLNQGTPSLFNQGIGASALNIFSRPTPFDLFAIPGDINGLLAGGGAPAGASTVSIDPDFAIPSTWKADLSVEREMDLGWFGDDWRFGFQFQFQFVKETYDLVELRLMPNGTLPDGRPRYIGDNPATPVLDRALTGVGDSGFDIVFRNSGIGNSRALSWTVYKSYDWVDVNLAYTRQDTNSLIDGQVGGTTGQSQYSGTAVFDPNVQAIGTSAQEVKNSLKYEFGFNYQFFRDLKSRLTFFGERRSGRPYSYTFADPAATGNTTRSPVFGALGSPRFLFFVPDFANDTNPNDLRVGQVFFNNAVTRDQIRALVENGPLDGFQGQVAPRNRFRSEAVNRLDVAFYQELPFFLGHRPEIYFKVDNFLNLMNHRWGLVREFGSQTQVVQVTCADVNGVSNAAANVSCPNYLYQNPNINPNPNNADADTPGLNLNNTRWTAAIGLRYKF